MSFIKDFKDSFKPNYKKKKLKSAIKYLAVLIFLFSLISVGQYWYDMRDFRLENFPEISIINGEVKFEGEEPYTVSNEEPIIIDTQNLTNINDYEKIVLISKNKVTMKNEYEKRTIDLSSIKEFNINKTLAYKLLIAFGIFVSVLIILFYYLGLILYTLFASLIALLIANIKKSKIKYEQLWIICAYTLTPVLTIGLVLNLIGINFLFRNTIIYIIYIILIIKD